MTEAAKQARRDYQKEWRAKNKERVAESNRKYRESHKEKLNSTMEDYWERRANGKKDDRYAIHEN